MRPGEFVIRPYSVSELASLYRPEVQAGQARKWLWQAVACRTGLIETLQTLGYHKGNRMFTPAQVEVIVKGIGTP